MLYLYEIRGTPDMYSPRVPIENYLESIRDNQQLRNFWLMRLANEMETEEWVANTALGTALIHRAYAITFSARGELPSVAEAPLATNPQYVEQSTTTSSTVLSLTRSADAPWYMPGRRFFDRVPVAFASCFRSPPAGSAPGCDAFEPTHFMNDKYDIYSLLFDSDDEL